MSIPAIAIHGGAGTIRRSELTREIKAEYLEALQEAINRGYGLLEKHGSALDAVIRAVCSLEDCELFNAGKGSVFNAKGSHKMDASVMEGEELRAGAVAGIHGIKNPILLAQKVLEDTGYVLLTGKEAVEFARHHDFEVLLDSYFFSQKRYDQWLEIKGSDETKLDHSGPKNKNLGTVGAVAVDKDGNVAAATSTGGLANKAWGRVGDSGLIGAGTYANNRTCAVSCTGEGEFFIRGVAAHDVSCLMDYKGMSLEQAADKVINTNIKKLGGEGGLIAVDAAGNIAMPFNSEGMYRGMKTAHIILLRFTDFCQVISGIVMNLRFLFVNIIHISRR